MIFRQKKLENLSAEEVSNTIAQEAIKEIRANRRSSFLFRMLILAYAILSTFLVVGTFENGSSERDQPHAAVVDILGTIDRKGGVNAYRTITYLESAFENKQSQVVVLNMDSPGGSPAQSDLLYQHITKLKTLHNKKTVAVIGDRCASGCVFIASAADEILLSSETSIYGNIGVRMEMFNFHQIMNDLHINRTAITAGKHKTLLDPFQPNNDEALAHLQNSVVNPTYERFKAVVREGRGEKLKENEDTFTGLIWVGQAVIDQGLADGFGDLISVSEAYQGGYISYSKRDFKLQDLVMGTAASLKNEALNFTGLEYRMN